jgi:hypothetical protein
MVVLHSWTLRIVNGITESLCYVGMKSHNGTKCHSETKCGGTNVIIYGKMDVLLQQNEMSERDKMYDQWDEKSKFMGKLDVPLRLRRTFTAIWDEKPLRLNVTFWPGRIYKVMKCHRLYLQGDEMSHPLHGVQFLGFNYSFSWWTNNPSISFRMSQRQIVAGDISSGSRCHQVVPCVCVSSSILIFI